MPANAAAGGSQRGRTFTESARRAQIVAAAIAVINEHGYAAASFTRIAKQAGLSSTGMISYHFANKDDLIGEVLTEATTVAYRFISPRMEAVDGYRAKLRARLESNMELVRAHPGHVRALMEIARNAPTTPEFVDDRFGLFSGHLRAGQAAGEFGPFNADAMAVAIIGAIDAMVIGLVLHPEVDATEFGRELADAFDRATRPS
jgi:AcrR family transcriptional regulator